MHQASWINGEGIINERPALYRANTGLFELMISITLQNPDERGFSGEDELNQLSKFEDIVVPALAADDWGHLAVVLTTDGFRDFIFYIKDPDSIRAKMRPLETNFKDLQVDIRGQPDPDWTQLTRFSGR